MRHSRITAAAATLALAIVLAGCSAATHTTAAGTPPTATASTAPTSQPVAAGPTPSPTAQGQQPDGCILGGAPLIDTDTPGQVTVDPVTYSRLRDRGPRYGATGKTTFSKDGKPATYTVAPNDSLPAIADRFCISMSDLGDLNAVRWCPSHTLSPGDVFNLNPYTIATVGGEASGICHITAAMPTPQETPPN